MIRMTLFAGTLATCLGLGRCWAEVYSVKDLGLLSGGNDSRPNAINQNGKVAAVNLFGGAYRALLYGGAWTNLGTLGGTNSYAGGINALSQVAGYSLTADG